MSDGEAKQKEKPEKKAKGCLGWLWRISLVTVLVVAGLLVWLNGPGMRWLGPKVAEYFIEKAGMEGSLSLGGTLLGGVDVLDLDISSEEGAIKRLVVDRLETEYRLGELIKGKLRGISAKGIHAEMRLVEKEEESPPLDFQQLGKTLNSVRERIAGMSVNLEEVSFLLLKDGERVVSLEESGLAKQAGSDEIRLDIGRVTDANGRSLEPQQVTLIWGEGQLALDQLDLLPIVGIRDLEVMLPEDGRVSATADLRLDGARIRLDVEPGISGLQLDLVEGSVDFANVTEALGMKLPVEGRLSSLAVKLEDIYPAWQTGTGTAELFVEGVTYDGWEVPELSLGLRLDEGEFGVKLAGQALGTEIEAEGGGKFERDALVERGFVTDGLKGDLRIAKLGEVVKALDAKLEMNGRFADFPASTVSGSWKLDLENGAFAGVGVDLKAVATEVEASPIRLEVDYAGKMVDIRTLETEGRKISGTFDLETRDYQLSETMDGFQTDSIAPWLKGAGVELPGSGVFSLRWEGSGNLLSNVHKGAVADFSGTWNWKKVDGAPARAPISASGGLLYEWPGLVELDGMVLKSEGQTIALDAKLKGDTFELEKFVWSDASGEIASGSGTLPFPEDFTDFKGFLAKNDRPLDLSIKSKSLPLSKLEPWVKGLEKIGDKATGMVDIRLRGSLAKPEVDATVEVRGISVPDRPELPETDITLKLDARGGLAKITGEALAPGYAPATVNLEMPFLPKQWAEDPESFKKAKIAGTLDLPRVDLSRFQGLVPGAGELKGIAEGKIEVKGTIGDPEVSGDLNLSGGKLAFDNDAIPALDGMNLDIQTNLQEVTVKGGIERLEGGFLDLDGSIALKESAGRKAGEMDVTVKARGLPVMRNDFLIIRANADLRVKGSMTDALVTGEIGILDSMFYKDMELIPIGRPFLEPSPAKLPGIGVKTEVGSMVPLPFSGWTADVVVKTIDPILIRGNLGKGEVDVALRVEGKLGDPKPNGTIRLRDAVARLPFSTLKVRQGTLTFSPATGLDPIVELRGTAEPRPYRVQVFAYGRMSDPQLVLTSQPPLPENEIMTLLATGTTSSGLEDSQAASSRALQLLIEEVRRGRFLFGKQLRPLLGFLDDVDFSLSEGDPYSSETYNSARLQLSDKWFVSAGIGSTGNQRVMVIYRLRFK